MLETATIFMSADIEHNPECLIPNRLAEIVEDPSKLFAASVIREHGRLDQEYHALTTFIGERGAIQPPRRTQIEDEESDSWAARLNAYRSEALTMGYLDPADALLIVLKARPYKIKSSGVYIDLFLEAPSIRSNHVGQSFFNNLAKIYRSSGYNFMCGKSLRENEGFYLKTGWQEYITPPGGPILLDVNTIKYLG